LAHEWPHAVREAEKAAAATCQGLLKAGSSTAEASPSRGYNAEVASGPHPAVMVAWRRRRNARQNIPIGVKKQIVRLRDASMPWDVVLRQLPIPVNKNAGRRIMQSAAQYRAMPIDPRTLARTSSREGKWPELDALLYKWYLSVYSLGHRRIPITTALLQKAACMIADQLSIVGFKASHGYVRGFLKRRDICNIVMHGQAGDANLAAAAAGVQKILRRLDAYPPDRIYNMDETGFLYKCLPSRSYVPRRDRRIARGTKAMSSMDRVTLVLCTSATGSHKLPVAMVGTANKPLCFRGEGNASLLPYFAQKKAWMDKYVYAQWWKTVFLPAVRERHGGTKCALIMDNSSTHDVELSAEDVEILFLPPNTTAVYQPMDAGVIVSLKRRYTRRLLAILVRSFPVPLVPPPPLSPSSPPRPPQPHEHAPSPTPTTPLRSVPPPSPATLFGLLDRPAPSWFS